MILLLIKAKKEAALSQSFAMPIGDKLSGSWDQWRHGKRN
jgi:hypothetical protein